MHLLAVLDTNIKIKYVSEKKKKKKEEKKAHFPLF